MENQRVGSLQEEALKRKEKLKSLKQKNKEPSEKNETSTEEGKLPKPIFRSYKPQDESLKQNQLPAIKPPEVTEKVKDQLEASKPEPLVEEVDLVNLAPRKPDWDLKRDVAKKLEKLEKRTQRAIAELIRDRLQAGTEDLASAVNASAMAAQVDED